MKLETQLRAYFEEFDTTLEPLEVEQVPRPQVPGRPPRVKHKPLPGWAVAVTAFVTLLISIGGLGLLINRSPEETTPVTEPPTTLVTTTAPTTTTQATTTTTAPESTTMAPEPPPAPTVSQAPITLRRIEDTDTTRFQDSPIQAIIAGGPGFIAVGSEQAEAPDGSFANDAAVWVSPDGETWERIDSPVFGAGTDDPGDEMGTQWMSDAATDGDRIVAVGYEGYAAAVWTSVDGYNWERVIDDALPPGTTDSYMNAVAVYEGGFIAVGSHRSDAGIWLSPDGLDWTQVVDDDLLGDSDGNVQLRGVTAYESGFVAVGDKGFTNFEGGESFDLVIAVSADGRDWERIAVVDELSGDQGLVLPPDVAGHNVSGNAVLASGDRLIVTAEVGVGDGALFSSDDGRNWQAEPMPAGAGQGGLTMWGDNLVTVGKYEAQNPSAVWLTAGDMTEWLVAPVDERAALLTAVPLGNRLVLGGVLVYSGDNGQGFGGGIWIGTWDE
jgi:hypothetical protein